jgi:hypothetical protein
MRKSRRSLGEGGYPIAAGAAALSAMLIASIAVLAAAPPQDTSTPGAPAAARGRRGSPPQPQQQQGLDYFIGTWTFSWTGRESPISSGPRSGSVTCTRIDGNSAEMRAEGTSDAGGAFKESGILRWNDAGKTLAFQETLANNIQMSSVGNWSSPISILVEGQPVQAQGQTLRLKRTYSILSATSFRVTDELSTNGGAFSRLGVGDFRKSQK